MIKCVQGDFLTANTDAYINTVNCDGISASGIPLHVKQVYPESFLAYQKVCQKGELDIGNIFVFPVEKSKFIINFPIKRNWRDSSEIEYIESGLKTLLETIDLYNIRSISIPILGFQNSGLSLEEVRSLIISEFRNRPDIRVLLYTSY